MAEIKRVTEADEIQRVAELAHEIWNQHFVPIIGQKQVDYMVDKFQSAPVIAEQIAQGYDYYLVGHAGQPAGYFALVPNLAEARAMLSKIYLKKDVRGHGLGRSVMTFVVEHCQELGVREVWLTVNRHNTGPIAFYESMGFVNAGTLVQDIGNGFEMDDFKMVKKLPKV
jgi:ribosomal protein S18 acetylase RimI-like enzyme